MDGELTIDYAQAERLIDRLLAIGPPDPPEHSYDERARRPWTGGGTYGDSLYTRECLEWLEALRELRELLDRAEAEAVPTMLGHRANQWASGPPAWAPSMRQVGDALGISKSAVGRRYPRTETASR